MEVPLSLHVPDDAGFLQQVCRQGSVSPARVRWDPPPRTGDQYSQLLMTPPRGSPLKSNSTSMYLP